MPSALEQLWYGDSLRAHLARAALRPAELVYAGAVRVRGTLYDRGLLARHAAPLPVLAVGNLSVGGTGKTPVTAWAVARLRERGARPAVVLRGYGGDEPIVHERLNPGLTVVVDPDRVRGARAAHAAGADCVVMDDAFQHRRVVRLQDWVLVSAERFDVATRLLPAGPLREPRGALARASVVIVTRKIASAARAAEIADRLESASRVPAAVVHLAPSGTVNAVDGSPRGLDVLRDARVVAVAAVGAPDDFFGQLRELGAREVRGFAFRDHHDFSSDDVRRVVAAASGADAVVCTLKDAVKLAPLWPRDAIPLWYVSQRADVERGAAVLDASLASILAARASTPSPAGPPG
ncbi:MAG TPA: tetraacyldisaccharide 4'-kinase [Gemmatimonadaceae bacterium]|nr:tetraacyldisaccharide 4'-kinase [Gemmatimonadaceae bacterium]